MEQEGKDGGGEKNNNKQKTQDLSPPPIRDVIIPQPKARSPPLYISPIEPQYSQPQPQPQSSPPLSPISVPSVAQASEEVVRTSSSSSSSFSVPPSTSGDRRMSDLLINGEPGTHEEIFNMYLLDYMKKKGMHNAAEIFQQEAGVRTDPIKVDEQPDGFLKHWWSTTFREGIDSEETRKEINESLFRRKPDQ